MIDTDTARPLELVLQRLFGEDSYQLKSKPCTGKYLGHTDYTLVFGSGRRLYVGLDERNYINSLWEHLQAIRYFRAHQAENTRRINATLLELDIPYTHAEAEIVPYDSTNDLTLYAAVILSTSFGLRFIYRTTNKHGCLVGYDAPCFAFDRCMEHFLKDIRGKMAYTHPLMERDAA